MRKAILKFAMKYKDKTIEVSNPKNQDNVNTKDNQTPE